LRRRPIPIIAHANWYAIGLEDGARGRPLERLGDHRRACAEHKIAPDAERYVAGRNEGLKSFCTYERGFSQGRSGQTYAGSCPANLAANFPNPRQRAVEVERLEDLTRESVALEERIQGMTHR
jgi:hypothetical protein